MIVNISDLLVMKHGHVAAVVMLTLFVFVSSTLLFLEIRVLPNTFAFRQPPTTEWERLDAGCYAPGSRRIVQTNKTSRLPKRMVRHARQWKRMNPDWGYNFFDDERATQVMEQDENKLTKLALNHLRTLGASGAAIADLFRSVEIAERGGFYVDMDCGPIDQLTLIKPGDDAVFYIEHQDWLCHWCFFATAKHPIIMALKNEVISRVLSTTTWQPGGQIFHVTGPGVLNDVALQLIPNARRNGEWVAGTYELGAGRTVRLEYSSLLPHFNLFPVTHGVRFARLPCSQRYYGSSADQSAVSPHYKVR